MTKRCIGFALGTVGLAAALFLWLRPTLHLMLTWPPVPPRAWNIYFFLLAANAFWLYNLLFHIRRKPRWVPGAYVAWYGALFLFFVAVGMGRGW